tara:strand:- start:1317 stop:1862 length:546 start_codon:yes stop_codon:yes gene_type:complete
MVDTQKSLSTLQSDLADNTSGDITPQDVRDFLVSVYAEYGEVSVKDNATATSLTTQSTWYQFVSFDTNGASEGVTPDHTNDHLTIATAGTYEISANVSFLGSSNSDFELAVYKNNGASLVGNAIGKRAIGTGGDIGQFALSGLGALSATDTLELWVRCTDGASKEITGVHVTMYCKQVSGP